jgi:hypothetical protein
LDEEEGEDGEESKDPKKKKKKRSNQKCVTYSYRQEKESCDCLRTSGAR